VELSNDGGQTWQYLENTLQQDVSWRRNAFRIADVIEPTSEFQMRFIASDSTTLGEYLDGGSLIEAAVDDIILYDLASGQNVEGSLESSVLAFPNPTRDFVELQGWMPGSTVRLIETASGRLVGNWRVDDLRLRLDLSGLAVGHYQFIGTDRNGYKAHWAVELVE
jgi:hypothetical protein